MENLSALLRTFFAATAWPMETPKAYGPFHLSFTILGFILCWILARRLKNLSDKGHRLLMLGVGIYLLAAELYKQLLYYYVVSPDSYVWGIFPFHLCSIPMYLCIIAPLLRPGRLQRGLYTFMMLYNLLGGGIAFAEPSGLLHPYVTLTAHSMIWHMLLVFLGLYLMYSGRGGNDIRDYRDATVIFLTLCAAAFGINLAFREISGGALNMFFVGPGNSSLIVFKQISEYFGWYFSTALYIPAVCLGSYLVFSLIRLYRARSPYTQKS